MKHVIKLSLALVAMLIIGLQINTDTAAQVAAPGTPTPFMPVLQIPDNVPPLPGDYAVLPGSIGGSLPGDITTPPEACDTAAGSYVTTGIEAVRNTIITFDDIVYNNQDETWVSYALYALEGTEFLESRLRYAEPNGANPVGSFNDGDIVRIGSESVCLELRGATFRFWQLESGEWVIDTVAFTEPIDLTSMWPQQDPQNPGQQIQAPPIPVLAEGVVFRYLMGYVEPPITTLPNASDQIAPSDDQLTVCEGTAPSYLAPGMQVRLSGYGYVQYPVDYDVDYMDWTFSDSSFALGDHGFGVFTDILNTTPLVNIVGNLESVGLSPQELYGNGLLPQATVLSGPYCTAMNAEPPFAGDGQVTEAPDPREDRFYTWWEINLNGNVGYYPENVGQYSHWLWLHEGIFPRKLSLYYMIPAGEAMQTASCDALPPTIFFAGARVDAPSRLNRRATPNGDVIGVLEAGQPTVIYGEPVCEGGTRWWQSDRGGWIAEFDPERPSMPIFRPYVEPTPTMQPTSQPTATATMPPPPPPQETRPPQQPTQVPPTQVPPTQVVTDEPTREPTRVRPTATTCDATGNCS